MVNAFDPLASASKLRESGAEESLANATVEVVQDATSDLVTRDYFDARLETHESRTDARFEAFEARFEASEARADARFEAFESRFEAHETRTDGRLETHEARTDAQFAAVRGEISELRGELHRALWIQGGVIITIVAALLAIVEAVGR